MYRNNFHHKTNVYLYLAKFCVYLSVCVWIVKIHKPTLKIYIIIKFSLHVYLSTPSSYGVKITKQYRPILSGSKWQLSNYILEYFILRIIGTHMAIPFYEHKICLQQ